MLSISPLFSEFPLIDGKAKTYMFNHDLPLNDPCALKDDQALALITNMVQAKRMP
jgi:hypothetical protein